MTFPKKVVNADAGDADHAGGNDWDDLTDQVTNLRFATPYKYTIFLDGADTKCLDNDTGLVVSTNTNARTPIQYAVDNAAGKPILITAGVYNIGSSVDLKGKHVTIHGEKSTEDYDTVGQTVLKKNYSATSADIFLDAFGADYFYVELRHLVVQGDDEGVGVKYTQNFRTMEDVWITDFRTGLRIEQCVYTNLYNVMVTSCVDYGVYMVGPDTLFFYGGRISHNGINLYIDDGEECAFFGTIIEHGTTYSAYLNSNTTTNQPNQIAFYACNFESWNDSLVALVYDEGRCNTYHKCKFNTQATDLDSTAIQIGANGRDIEFHSCQFKANTGPSTYRIIIDAGAQRIRFLHNNTHAGGQISSFVFTDNGTDTICVGNQSIPDRTPYAVGLARTQPMASTDCWGTGTPALAPFTATLISSATTNSVGGEAEHPGIVKGISSTTANSGLNLNLGTNTVLLQGGEQFECILRFSSFTNNTVRIGFGDTTTNADNTDGVYFEMAGSSTISAKTSSASTRTTNANTYTASTATWYHFKINVVSSSLVEFLIYDDAGAELYNRTNTANIPTGAGRQCGVHVIGTNSTTTGSIDIYEIDYIAVATGGLGPLTRGLR